MRDKAKKLSVAFKQIPRGRHATHIIKLTDEQVAIIAKALRLLARPAR